MGADPAPVELDGGARKWGMGMAIPGLTVPWTHAVYLWIATGLSMAVHEVGLMQATDIAAAVCVAGCMTCCLL